LKQVSLTNTGQSMAIDVVELLDGKSLQCQIWEGTDEHGEPVKFVVCGYIVTERNLPAQPALAPEEEP